MSTRKFIAVCILFFTFGIASSVTAQENYYAKDGLYIGFNIPFNNIGGDFNGDTFLTDGFQVILIPEVESSSGLGISVGGRFSELAFELNYLSSTHDATFLGAKGEADYNMVNLDFKYYYSADKRFQPNLLFGLCVPWLVVKDGSSDGVDVGDATFQGFGLNIGGGIAYYINPRVSISGGVIYRWISYHSAEGVSGGSQQLDDNLDGSGIDFNVGITYTF